MKNSVIARTLLFGFFVFILLAFMLIGSVKAQTIWVADNNFNAPTGANIFPTIQEAVNAALDGDIVYVQPSPTIYAGIIVDKQITIVGIGFNLDKDLPLQSTMGNITLTNNADNTSDASGTVIQGLTFGNLYLGGLTGPTFTLSDVVVENCQLTSITQFSSGYGPIDNLLVKGCLITSSSTFWNPMTGPSIFRNNMLWGGLLQRSGSPSNIVVANNLMYASIRITAAGGTTDVRNNNFIGATGSDIVFNTSFSYGTVANNIFYGRTPSITAGGASASALFQLNVFTNNLSFGTGNDELPPSGGGAGNSGSGNIVASDPMFTNSQLLNTWDATYDFTLQVGSPAADAGTDGTDLGITGGAYPWTLGNHELLTTGIPTIQTLDVGSIINPGDDLSVHIIVKGN